MVFMCPNIHAHNNEAVLCLNFGTPENNEFSIWNKWKIYYFWVSQYLSTLGYQASSATILTQARYECLWSNKPTSVVKDQIICICTKMLFSS